MDNDEKVVKTEEKSEAKPGMMGMIKRDMYVPIFGSLAIGLLVGIFFASLISHPTQKIVPQYILATPTPDPKLVTDPSTILKNAVFDEWYGGFQAKVISKTANSFTIQKGGQTLEIFMQKSISRIADQTVSKSSPPIITLDQLPIGSTVEGTATISIGTLTGNPDQHVIADGVYVISK